MMIQGRATKALTFEENTMKRQKYWYDLLLFFEMGKLLFLQNYCTGNLLIITR